MTIDSDWVLDRVNELKASVLFLTRLPLARATTVTGKEIGQAGWAFPLAGALVGAIGALVYALAWRVGLPAWPAAALAIAATLAVTGCLHEDGLADVADGFGGGHTREQKLAIMRDSRVGTYGLCALVLSILLRGSALASIGAPGLAVPALIAAHAAARATIPALMLLMPPARADGLAFSAGRPPLPAVIVAGVLGFVALVICLGPALALLAAVLLGAVAALTAWLSLAQIGGQTGDVLGALEQAGEVVILLVAVH
jgi:adenosylcobinamide-GDP ribazoletransferase